MYLSSMHMFLNISNTGLCHHVAVQYVSGDVSDHILTNTVLNDSSGSIFGLYQQCFFF